MGQGSLSTSPCFLEDICLYSEKKLGFWEPKTMHYSHETDGKVQMLDSMSVVSSPLEELFPVGAVAVDCLERPLSRVARDHEEKLYIGGENRTPSFSVSSGGYVNNRKESPNLYMQAISRTPSFSRASGRYVNNRNESPNLYMKAVSSSVDTNKTDINGNRYGNCLSSSILAEVFGRKTGLSTNNVPFHKSAGIVDSCHGEDKSFGSTEDIVAQTIGDLLPDEDDLFSGLIDKLEYIADAKRGDDGEDFDLFSSVGGMELEVDDDSCVDRKDSVFNGGVIIGQGNSIGSLVNALPYDERPSRTLFVRNINSNVEDSELRAHGGRPVGRFNIGTVEDLHSASHVPFNALSENAFSLGSSCVLNSLPSPLREASSGNCFGFQKPSHSMDQVEFGGKCLSSFHPHSSPDCQGNFNIFIPGNSSSTVTNMAGKFGSKVSEGINDQQTTMIGSNGQPVALKGGVSGPPGNVTCTVLGHHWSNSYSFQNHPLSPTVWPNSPLFSDDLNASCSPQLLGYARVPPDMLNPFSPPHHIHVGSAPSVSPSLGDRQHGYTRESPESSAFCLASVGNVGFLGHSPLHLLGRASHVFSHAAGNCVEKSTNDALHSPKKMSPNCPGRKPVTSLPTSFGSPREYGRNLSHRRNHGSSSHADKKQFELDIDHILCGEDSRTTLMIKNIPNKYTSKMLLSTIDEHCRGTYDFIYLPIDFKNKCNVGYAFINLVDPFQIIPFYKAFNGRKWEKFNSEKVAALTYARIQGKAALVAHFQNSSLMNEDKRCHPILFCTDGPNAGEQEPFPTGTNIRSRAFKAQSIVKVENQHQEGPTSNSVD